MVLCCLLSLSTLGAVFGWQSSATGSFQAQAGLWDTCPDTVAFFITPKTFNTKSGNDGKGLTVHFVGGLPAGFTSDNVQLMEMRVAPDGVQTINAEAHSANDNAGVVKFTKDDLVSLLDGLTGEVTLEVSGAAGGCEFAGTDTITVISPGGGPEHSQQAEGALVPGGDEELLDGGDEFTIIEPGTDESGYLDDAFSDEGQEEDATNEDDSGAGSDGEQTDDLTPPVAGLPDTDQTGNLDEIDEPEQPEEHQTLDPEDKQADENGTTPNAPEVEKIVEQDEKQEPEPETIQKDDNQQNSGDFASEPEQKQDE